MEQRRGTDRHRLASAQPSRRRVRGASRVVHRIGRQQPRARPAAASHVQPSRAAAAPAHRRRPSDGARLPVHEQQDVARLRRPPPGRDDGDVRRRHRDQPRRGHGDRVQHARRRPVADGHEVRQLPHVALRARRSTPRSSTTPSSWRHGARAASTGSSTTGTRRWSRRRRRGSTSSGRAATSRCGIAR